MPGSFRHFSFIIICWELKLVFRFRFACQYLSIQFFGSRPVLIMANTSIVLVSSLM